MAVVSAAQYIGQDVYNDDSPLNQLGAAGERQINTETGEILRNGQNDGWLSQDELGRLQAKAGQLEGPAFEAGDAQFVRDLITRLMQMSEQRFGAFFPAEEEFFKQITELLKTGGIGAQTPLVARGTERAKQATSRALTGTGEELTRLGLTGTPFGQRILGDLRLAGSQAEGQAPFDVYNAFLSMLPTMTGQAGAQVTQGATGAVSGGADLFRTLTQEALGRLGMATNLQSANIMAAAQLAAAQQARRAGQADPLMALFGGAGAGLGKAAIPALSSLFAWLMSSGAATGAATGGAMGAGSMGALMMSDPRLKQGVTSADRKALLARLRKVPVMEWSYTFDPEHRHVGPMADAFNRAVGVDPENRSTIHAADALGAVLASVQAIADDVERLKRARHVIGTRAA